MVRPYQFRLRGLFGSVLFVAIVFGSLRAGPLPCLYFGIAVGWLASRVITEGPVCFSRTLASALQRPVSRIAVLATAVFATAPVALGWWPYNSSTVMLLVGVNAWQLLLCLLEPVGKRTLFHFVRTVPVLCAAYPLFWIVFGREEMPWFVFVDNNYYVEWRTDRRKLTLLPDFAFCKNGPNHSLLKEFGPDRPDVWALKLVMGPSRFTLGDKVNPRSVLIRPTLPRILSALPNDRARRTVVDALSDEQNMARVHQGMLLTWMVLVGAPEREAFAKWWSCHQELFGAVHDPQRAARLVVRWPLRIVNALAKREATLSEETRYEIRMQSGAAQSQQRGYSEGAEAFSEACFAIQRAEE